MKTSQKIASGVGAGLLAAGAAAAGYYFYASRNAKQNRRIVVSWASNLKRDVMKEARKLGAVDRRSVVAAIDRVAALYEAARSIKGADIERAARELRGNWQEIVREAGVQKPAKRALKARKKVGTPKRSRSKAK